MGSSGTLRIEAGTWLNKFIVTLPKLWLGVVFGEDPLWDMEQLAQFSDDRLVVLVMINGVSGAWMSL